MTEGNRLIIKTEIHLPQTISTSETKYQNKNKSSSTDNSDSHNNRKIDGRRFIIQTQCHVPRRPRSSHASIPLPERKTPSHVKNNEAASEIQNKTEARSYILRTQNHVPPRVSTSSVPIILTIPAVNKSLSDEKKKKAITESSHSRSFLDTHNHKHMQKKIDCLSSVGQSSKCFCGICFDFKTEAGMFRRSKCNHPFCADCISKHVATQIQQNILKVNCPHPNCSIKLKPEYLQGILPKQVIDRWECARVESSIASRQKIYCPFKNCSVLLVNDGSEVVTSSECPSCHRLFCAQCKVPWHAGMSCKEFKRSKSEKKLESKFLELAKSEMWQKCPKCSIFVQRSSGCEHITCRCGCNFCYNCGKDWKYGHTCKKPKPT